MMNCFSEKNDTSSDLSKYILQMKKAGPARGKTRLYSSIETSSPTAISPGVSTRTKIPSCGMMHWPTFL